MLLWLLLQFDRSQGVFLTARYQKYDPCEMNETLHQNHK
jgi:hypothetical protein